jgi:hypothetical protein
MNFIYPAFLLGALAIAVPIVLHLLRRDVAPELPFTAVRLLRKSPVERSRRRRIRDLILLAARVAALLLLAAAFARPFAPAAASAMLPLRIVAVDRSFSMGAPGQFERALERARAAIDEAGFQERVALIAFDERADVLAPPGTAAEARRALSGLSVGHAGTRYTTVLAKAADLASGGPARLLLISDMQRTGWEGEARSRIPESLEVELIEAGPPAANLAIVDARLRDGAVIATLRNASAEPRTGTVTLQPETGGPTRVPFTVAAATTSEVRVPWAAAGPVTVSVEDPGGFPADDRRYLIAGAPPAATILVITSTGSPGYYVERAIAAAQEDEASPLGTRLVSPLEVNGGRAGEILRHRAVVLLATRTLDRDAREAIVEFVRKGGGLFIAAAADVEPDVLASMFAWTTRDFDPRRQTRAATFTATDVRHPVFRPFGPLVANLGGVRFSETWRVTGAGWQVPARFDDGAPALLERPEGQGRIVLFASDLDRRWNDFPVHPAFVPFIVETLRHVSSGVVEPNAYLVGRAPAAVGNEPGIKRVDGGRAVAVNVDGRESGTAVIPPDQFREMLQPVAQRAADPVAVEAQTEARQSLWMYGLILMLGVLVAESFVGRA